MFHQSIRKQLVCLAIVFVLFLVCGSVHGEDNIYTKEYRCVNESGKWGIINNKGEYIIKPQFDYIGLFEGNKTRAVIDGNWGLIDFHGKQIIDYAYDYISLLFYPASEDQSFRILMKAGHYYLYREKDSALFTQQFDYIDFADEEYLPHLYGNKMVVGLNGKKGIIDLSAFEMILPFAWDEIMIMDNLLIVEQNEKYGLSKSDGGMFLQPVYDEIISDGNGFGRMRANDGWRYFSINDNIISELAYTKIGPFCYNKACIWDGDTWRYMDITGKIVFDDSFDSASNYERNVAIVTQGEHHYVMDECGKKLFSFTGSCIDIGKTNLVLQQNGQYSLVDYSGNVLVPYGKYSCISSQEKNGIRIVNIQTKLNIIDQQGRELCPDNFDAIKAGGNYEYVSNSIFIKKANKWGCMSIEGNYIIPPVFDGIFPVAEEEAYGFIYSDSYDLSVPWFQQIDWYYIYKSDYQKISLPSNCSIPGFFCNGVAMVEDNMNQQTIYINTNGEILKIVSYSDEYLEYPEWRIDNILDIEKH